MAETNVRGYCDKDYDQVKELYDGSASYWGHFDGVRDDRDSLAAEAESDPEAILVYEDDLAIAGTISLVSTNRMAMLFRFAVRDNDTEVAGALYDRSVSILRGRGHTQAWAYSPFGDAVPGRRYEQQGMERGGSFTCYWQQLESE